MGMYGDPYYVGKYEYEGTKISVPMPLMKTIMNSGVSKITKIPSDGLNFITKRKFSNVSAKKLWEEIGLGRRV